MAGSYPDVPGYRFVYDLDGTIVTKHLIAGSMPVALSSGEISLIHRSQANFGAPAFTPADNSYVTFLFPETRTILGYVLASSPNTPSGGRVAQTSVDTTDGIDGTWVTQANPYGYINSSTTGFTTTSRLNINSVNWSEVKAVRFAVQSWVIAIHLYGSIATTESSDRLRIVDLANTDIAAQLDFGNLAQRASATRQFKVVNNSSTLAAHNITVSLDAPTDASPSLVGQYQISTDNVGFANAVNIGNLAPTAESGTLYVRPNPASNAQLGPWTARIIAHPTSWS